VRWEGVTLEGMYEERSRVVAAVAAGHSLRAIGRRFEIAPRTALRGYLEAVPDDPETVAAALEVLPQSQRSCRLS
jgi:hypothetical protein